jgi:hypothetical protein
MQGLLRPGSSWIPASVTGSLSEKRGFYEKVVCVKVDLRFFIHRVFASVVGCDACCFSTVFLYALCVSLGSVLVEVQ